MSSGNNQETIEIYCRLRPVKSDKASYKIEQAFDNSSIEFHRPKHVQVGHINNSRERYQFSFNGLFDMDINQDDVYERCAKKCVASALDGYNSTLFAYGQTGSGKTWTMTGGSMHYKDRGIIPRAITHVFNEIANRPDVEFNLYVSYMEIYNNQPYDLLDKNRDVKDIKDLKKLILQEDREGTIHFKNYHPIPIRSEEEALEILFVGDQNRALSETEMNEASSRSHCIFSIHIDSKSPGATTYKSSKLHLVDLAGSERVEKSGSTGQTLTEAKNINLSLHFLEQVIVALTEKKEHIPYRNSTITWLLRDSLGGNCKTVMIATINPSKQHLDESVATCRFAQRVASIKQSAVINERVDPKIQITIMKKKIAQLEEELSFLRGDNKDRTPIDDNERAIIRHKIEEYVSDKDPLSDLNLGGDILRIKEAFSIFKELLIHARKKTPTTNHLPSPQTESVPKKIEVLPPKSQQPPAIPLDVQEQLKNLAIGIELRDKEIDILVGMLEKKNNHRSDVSIQTTEGTTNTSNYTSASYNTPTIVERSESSAASYYTKEAIKKKIEEQKADILRSSSNAVNNAKEKNQEEPKFEYSNEKVMQMASAHGMINRAKAFEVFRKSYRQNGVIEKNKLVLKEKIEEAKALGKQLAETKNYVNKLKEQLVQRRTERAAQGLIDKNSTVQDDEDERQLKEEMIAQREEYNRVMEQLLSLKKEIKYIENALMKSAEKVKKDFQQWYATTGNAEFETREGYEDNVQNYRGSTSSESTDFQSDTTSSRSERTSRSDVSIYESASTSSKDYAPSLPRQAWGDSSDTTHSSSSSSISRDSSNFNNLRNSSMTSSSVSSLSSSIPAHSSRSNLNELNKSSITSTSSDFKSKLHAYMNMKSKDHTQADHSTPPVKRTSLLDRARNY